MAKERYDQYGCALPDDLVVLSGASPDDFTDYALDLITSAHWYEAGGMILIPAKQVKYCLEDDPADVGVDLATADVSRIADCLKRWSVEDGFYHA